MGLGCAPAGSGGAAGIDLRPSGDQRPDKLQAADMTRTGGGEWGLISSAARKCPTTRSSSGAGGAGFGKAAEIVGVDLAIADGLSVLERNGFDGGGEETGGFAGVAAKVIRGQKRPLIANELRMLKGCLGIFRGGAIAGSEVAFGVPTSAGALNPTGLPMPLRDSRTPCGLGVLLLQEANQLV